jgi:large subunit ribosomal protein L35
MPKLKTHRAANKRFRTTGTGKLRRNRAYHAHILTKKSPGRKARLGSEAEVSAADAKVIRKMLPYL